MLELTATRVRLDGARIDETAAGPLRDAVLAHLRGEGPPGLVVLGGFGSGKTHLCTTIAAATDGVPVTVVPLRDVARHGDAEAGLRRVVGAPRLAEARAGRRVLLLDGLDEVPPQPGRPHPAWFDALITAAGPRWVLTSRPGHFRTDAAEAQPDQVDVLSRDDVTVLSIDPLSRELVHAAIGEVPGGERLLASVDGLEQLATSPLLLHVVHAALPYIEPGRPIRPWGVFDAWIRFALTTGPGHDARVDALEALAEAAFRDRDYSPEVPTWSADALAHLPQELRRALFVTELDGRMRFGHRSVYEFLLASRIAPKLAANQGQGPDALSGRPITEAVRVFLVGRVPPMPVVFDRDAVVIPRGNFVSGGDVSPDERPLRVVHLDHDVRIARLPVTHADWARFLAACPGEDRVDANYLRHWGLARRVPPGLEDAPVYHVWPEDADRYAAWAGARLPTADEWEKAVRGIDGRRWPWGDFWRPDAAVTAELGLDRPLPARAFGAQGDAGLFAAVGSVFEYTATDYRGVRNRGRVVMGGCFTHPAPVSRASLRLSHKLSGHLKAGLRLAWDTGPR